MRNGAQYFTEPASSAQRRYEALRAYLAWNSYSYGQGQSSAEASIGFGT